MEPSSHFIKGRRLRLFGGPNGSGKTTIIQQIRSLYDIGIYVNPDDLEQFLKTNRFIDLSDYELEIDDPHVFDRFIQSHSLLAKARHDGFEMNLSLEGNRIVNRMKGQNSYEAALIADFLRTRLIQKGKKLTFESVMSHKSKVEVLRLARSNGYKTYLYFIGTSSPQINIERVDLRVKKGGHPVDPSRIKDRYFKSLSLLKEAIKNTYRSFIWDNSGNSPELILEVYRGNEVTVHSSQIPYWVHQHLLQN